LSRYNPGTRYVSNWEQFCQCGNSTRLNFERGKHYWYSATTTKGILIGFLNNVSSLSSQWTIPCSLSSMPSKGGTALWMPTYWALQLRAIPRYINYFSVGLARTTMIQRCYWTHTA